MKGRGKFHVGTSGWHYEGWSGPFYPENLPKRAFLSFYAKHFHTVEINNSFYRIPGEDTLKTWAETVPDGFVFAVKASRYITHMKKLKDAKESVSFLLKHIEVLDGKLGPVLFQLPPRWRFDAGRFRHFLEALPAGHRYAVELRDRSWQNPAACELMKKHGVAFCIYDLAGYQSPREITADFVYIRLHGPGGAYRGEYGPSALSGWADDIFVWAGQGRDVYCYFDNDEAGYAVQNALSLRAMTTTLGSGTGPRRSTKGFRTPAVSDAADRGDER
ncbi:MAG TPA: DUF72 domain-containing protein [Syntrophales bacterium]|nr:DUF72 domain-containing protein [Syntrophales bacterium]